MLKKCMSFFKLGQASIDLVLDSNELKPGQNVNGYFRLKGKWMKQIIKRLECDLILHNTEDKTEHMIESVTTIYMSKELASDGSIEIPLTYQLPENLLSSSSTVSYRFQTRLICDNMRCVDHDEITICS
ncbi:sporulation-control protein [Fictibacillus solisalsi]|uniref:Sporulation-control protein n=1 Tax=Fictibacillus solisalsi TaxID=459525 RepID=A0A1G9XAM4_9BACL|nr:sporulation protein [Fictibacillus solisalsi]SDM93727.1 sporulation-control protein [Fictibacillus solisalsi]